MGGTICRPRQSGGLPMGPAHGTPLTGRFLGSCHHHVTLWCLRVTQLPGQSSRPAATGTWQEDGRGTPAHAQPGTAVLPQAAATAPESASLSALS